MALQDNVGSVVKTSEEDDPIAVFTVLGMVGHKEQEWMQQLQSFVTVACKEEALKKKLTEVMAGGSSCADACSTVIASPYGPPEFTAIWTP